ncbi:MAG: hypothetical protein KKA81_13430 [Bacteroidetes bacterium]|nr:hypothetical protein [Bacteroidota bacterium]
MISSKKIKVTLLWALTIVTLSVQGQGLVISVNGIPAFPPITITEAGEDFNGTYNSVSGNQITVATHSFMHNLIGNFMWKVTVHKSDNNWDSSLGLETIRTGTGTRGSIFFNSITGGTNYQTITNLPADFFWGTGRWYDIPVAYRLNGVSVLLPADQYETTVIFTITDM